MNLKNIVIDSVSLHAYPQILDEINDCVVYISEANLNDFKSKVNVTIAEADTIATKDFMRNRYKNLIMFIRANRQIISSIGVRSEKLLFNRQNNVFIVIVKETKDITLFSEKLYGLNIDTLESDSLFLAVSENAQILTLNAMIIGLITIYKLPIRYLDIND